MMLEFARHVRQRWYLYTPLAAIWMLALVRLFFDPTPRLPLLFNVTPSLPYTVALMRGRDGPIHRGDFVVYSYEGGAVRYFPGLWRQPFFKQVGGVAGDRITVRERHVCINGVDAGYAKTHTSERHLALEPIGATVIPPGWFYMQGSSPDSFDSRYSINGLVPARAIIGVVTPLF